MDRREFLQVSAMLPTLGISPALFAKAAQTKGAPILLLVELKGANDGLNTLIPIDDPNYYRLRPKIAIKKESALSIGNGAAMHSSMKELMPYWQSGNLAWLQGLGYPEPNRSHFRSIEIWETASNSDEYDSEGWLTKLYAEQTQKLQGVVVGSDAGPLAGEKFDTIIMQDAKSFAALTKRLKQVRATSSNSALSRVLDVQNNVHQNSTRVIDALANNKGVDVAFPKSKFGKQLEQTANLITSGLGANIFKVELNGFDTHRGQERKHANLLKQLSQGLDAFSKTMQKSGNWDNTLIMTYSEFGRRVAENKSGGTDHGTAAAQMVMGGRVRGGLHGTAPRLDRLDDNGDLIYTSDFRSLYHTVATQWLGRPSPWNHLPAFELIHS